jgi:hypothetical protein
VVWARCGGQVERGEVIGLFWVDGLMIFVVDKDGLGKVMKLKGGPICKEGGGDIKGGLLGDSAQAAKKSLN